MRIYLAGPDVFLPAAARRGAALKAACARLGHEGVWPLDPLPQAPASWAALPEPQRIALGNEAHIRSCQALVANLTPFRGPNADPGTAFEIGFARMLGLKLAGWTNDPRCLATRTRAWLGPAARRDGDAWRDGEGLLVEDFGLTENLMLEGAILASGGLIARAETDDARRWDDLAAFERCLAAL